MCQTSVRSEGTEITRACVTAPAVPVRVTSLGASVGGLGEEQEQCLLFSFGRPLSGLEVWVIGAAAPGRAVAALFFP